MMISKRSITLMYSSVIINEACDVTKCAGTPLPFAWRETKSWEKGSLMNCLNYIATPAK